MIIGTGVDIAEVHRIRESIERFGDRFLRRIFTDGEIRIASGKPTLRELRGALCRQGSGMKALVRVDHGVRWRDIEVCGRRAASDHSVPWRAAAIAAKLGTKNIALSITHTSEEALAHVILEN